MRKMRATACADSRSLAGYSRTVIGWPLGGASMPVLTIVDPGFRDAAILLWLHVVVFSSPIIVHVSGLGSAVLGTARGPRITRITRTCTL